MAGTGITGSPAHGTGEKHTASRQRTAPRRAHAHQLDPGAEQHDTRIAGRFLNSIAAGWAAVAGALWLAGKWPKPPAVEGSVEIRAHAATSTAPSGRAGETKPRRAHLRTASQGSRKRRRAERAIPGRATSGAESDSTSAELGPGRRHTGRSGSTDKAQSRGAEVSKAASRRSQGTALRDGGNALGRREGGGGAEKICTPRGGLEAQGAGRR